MKSKPMSILLALALMLNMLVLLPAVPAGAAPEVVEQNPDLVPACEIKVALILDASASIATTAQQNSVRSAANAFLNGLENTGSQVAIVEFAALADTPVSYTVVTPASIGAVFAPYLSADTSLPGPQYHDNRAGTNGTAGAYTNWDHAFYTTNQLPEAPDLVVFVTDGVPTARGGYPGSTLVLSNVPTPTAAQLEANLVAAEATANLTKRASGAGGPWGSNAGNQGFGSHIFAVGVTGSTGLDQTSLYRVLDDNGAAGNTAFIAGPPSNFDEADYTTASDLSGLTAALQAVAEELCASSLTITKLVPDPNNIGSYMPAPGWTFTADGVAVSDGLWQWKQPCETDLGNPAPCDADTNTSGQIFFQWFLDDIDAETTSIQITETQQEDYVFGSVTCQVDGVVQEVDQAETFTLSDIPRDASASCTVINLLDTIPTAVTLADFSAACQAGTPAIHWETVSEIDNQGFNLYRGTSPDGWVTQVNTALIPAQNPGGSAGAAYDWLDTTAQPGQTYYYWLEDVDSSGATTMHGPVSTACSAPTAVTVSDISADSQSAPIATWWYVVAALAVALVAGFALQRRQKQV